MKVNKALVALIVAIICGTGVFAQKKIEIIKPDPEYGGFSLQFKVTQLKGIKYSLTYQYSGLQSFPTAFNLRTDSLKQDTFKTDSVMKKSFSQTNSDMPDPGTNFWLRIKMTDSTGVSYYSDTVYVETWSFAKMPWVDTLQGPQNNNGTVEIYVKYYSNVPAVIVPYLKFANSSNIFNFSVDTIRNLLSNDSSGLLIVRIYGIPSGSTCYVALRIINYAGFFTINAMKVMPYVAGGQKPTGTLDSLKLIGKTIRIRVKGVLFNSPGTAQISYGTSPNSLLDTMTRISFTGNGIEYGVWELDSTKGNTTYYFEVLFSSLKGSYKISFSKKTDADPVMTILWVDTAYGSNLDIDTKKMSINIRASFTLGTGVTSGEIWARVSRSPNFTFPYTSNSYFTTSTSGITGLLTLGSPMDWDTTEVWYAEVIIRNLSTNELSRSQNYKVVYQPRLKVFTLTIDGIQTDFQSKSGTINLKYENTEGSTSTIKMTISQNANMSGGITSPEAFASSSTGSIKFPINDLVAGKTYYIQGTGTNTYGKSTVSAIQSFTLGTNTGIYNIEKPEVKWYINPGSDKLIISISNNQTYLFELRSITGKIVISQEIHGETEIDKSGITEGIYFYRVGASTGKIVFQ